MASKQYDIAFALAKGMVGSVALELLRRVGTTELFFTLPRTELAALTGVDSDIFDPAHRQSLLEQAKTEEAFVDVNNIAATGIGDRDYPRRMRDCEDAPAIIYQLGKCDLDSAHTVAIVGTRHATHYGIDFTIRLVNELAEKLDNLVIISGLAYGIDAAAHKAALDANVPTVGVLAHGLNMIYPADHRGLAAKMVEKDGALVTEYTTAARVHRSNFLARNRIVAALSDALVVVESDFKGGAMATARIAQAYSRDVFALPGRVNDIYSRGTNHLIYNNTATLVRGADDIIAQLGWKAKAAAKPQEAKLFPTLSPDQQAVLDFIAANPDATVNDICVGMSLSYARTSNIIFELEMLDVIASLPGGKYAIR